MRRSTPPVFWAAGRSARCGFSEADARARHAGVSHHSLTAYFRVALVPMDLPVPSDLSPQLAVAVAAALGEAPDRVHTVTIDCRGLDAALRESPARLESMGRGLDEDHAYFLTNAAAGRHAASLLGS